MILCVPFLLLTMNSDQSFAAYRHQGWIYKAVAIDLLLVGDASWRQKHRHCILWREVLPKMRELQSFVTSPLGAGSLPTKTWRVTLLAGQPLKRPNSKCTPAHPAQVMLSHKINPLLTIECEATMQQSQHQNNPNLHQAYGAAEFFRASQVGRRKGLN